MGYTISISPVEENLYVRVSWFGPGQRYPRQLTDFVLDRATAESELGMIARCSRAVEMQCEALRLDEFPELPF